MWTMRRSMEKIGTVLNTVEGSASPDCTGLEFAEYQIVYQIVI